jgi:hypothetical protein
MSVELPEQYWMTVRCASTVHVIKDADCPQCRIAQLEAPVRCIASARTIRLL